VCECACHTDSKRKLCSESSSKIIPSSSCCQPERAPDTNFIDMAAAKSPRQLLLLSNGTMKGQRVFEYCESLIKSFFSRSGQTNVLFIPYAQHDYDKYTATVSQAMQRLGYTVQAIHQSDDPVDAVTKAKILFIGGGNSFLLLKTLYEKNLLEVIRKRVNEGALMYMGSSAGTNVATYGIHTTNDMPITFPPSFDALQLVPFNINPHYLDPDPNSTHNGETRETRINEFHRQGTGRPVLGLYEGVVLEVIGDKITLHGERGAKLFTKEGEEPRVFKDQADLSFLLN